MSFSEKPSKPEFRVILLTMRVSTKINCPRFYSEWRGHPIEDLETFHTITHNLRPGKPVVYLAGDSSLDNKAWVPSSYSGVPLTVDVPSIYNDTMNSRPYPKPDIALWLNHYLGERATCINTAIEESMLRQRDEQLLEHDEFIRDKITSKDVLIVSVGANDIALKPLPATMWNMFRLAWLTRRSSITNGSAWALPYFREMFGTKIEKYVSRLVANQKPRAIIVCMIYYPLEAGAGQQKSWADPQLKALGYSWFPGKLQDTIKQMYESATKNISIDGTQVIPCPLFEVLDGKKQEDFKDRVEPSAEGGRKMAEHFVKLLDGII